MLIKVLFCAIDNIECMLRWDSAWQGLQSKCEYTGILLC